MRESSKMPISLSGLIVGFKLDQWTSGSQEVFKIFSPARSCDSPVQCSLCRLLSTEIFAVGKSSMIRSRCQNNEAGLAHTGRDDRSCCQQLLKVKRSFLSYVITDIALYKSLEYVRVPFPVSCPW
jgi:hypothetical protein